MLPILAANLLALSVVSLTEGTPLLSCSARHRDKIVSRLLAFGLPAPRMRLGNMLAFSLFAKFWHTRGLHLHLGCVASLSNLSGTAHANCQHAHVDDCKNTQSTNAKTIDRLIQYMEVSALSYATKYEGSDGDETSGFTFIVNNSLSESFIKCNGWQEVRLTGDATFQMMISECLGKNESE